MKAIHIYSSDDYATIKEKIEQSDGADTMIVEDDLFWDFTWNFTGNIEVNGDLIIDISEPEALVKFDSIKVSGDLICGTSSSDSFSYSASLLCNNITVQHDIFISDFNKFDLTSTLTKAQRVSFAYIKNLEFKNKPIIECDTLKFDNVLEKHGEYLAAECPSET